MLKLRRKINFFIESAICLILLALDFKSPLFKSYSYKQERKKFSTNRIENKHNQYSWFPQKPPKGVFEIVFYQSNVGPLTAYLSIPAKPNQQKFPAIIWAHGGFEGIGDWLWKEKMYVQSFREQGFVVFCPSYRGENKNPGDYQLFLGEVDDFVSAIDYVSELQYVDENRIYLVGFSSGGTIVGFASFLSEKIRACYSISGRFDIDTLIKKSTQKYGYDHFAPYPFDIADAKERFIRSPHNFISNQRCPLYLLLGEEELTSDIAVTKFLTSYHDKYFDYYRIKGVGHFTLLIPATRWLAKEIAKDTGTYHKVHFDKVALQEEADQAIARNELVDVRHFHQKSKKTD